MSWTKRRKAEAELAEAQCWHAALLRLGSQSRCCHRHQRDEAVASQQVPKTKTAKSYPTKLQQLRNALSRALPGMPGVVMQMERCAELNRTPRQSRGEIRRRHRRRSVAVLVHCVAHLLALLTESSSSATTIRSSPSVPFGNLLGLQMTELAKTLIPDHPDKNAFFR